VTGRVGGKTALVTGAASRNGIGFATARALAREGANVLLTDLDATEVKARAAELESEGLHARGMIHDVTREVQWTSALDAAEAAFGFQTNIQKVAMADGGENSRRIHAAIPMQRMGRPEDVAVMILFLASDEAAYVTGAEFVVDGGLTAQ
jgi:NAD(P)-dependent dehydrogenase (short-subunit alcohol dehydrogenase family)